MRLSEVRPDDEELRVILETGFALRDAGRLEEAEAIFLGMAELLPGSELPHVALGTIKLQAGAFTEAQAACEIGLQIAPTSLYARVHYAEALLFQGRRSEAESELYDVITADAQSPHSRTARALLDAADLICLRGSSGSAA